VHLQHTKSATHPAALAAPAPKPAKQEEGDQWKEF
jgi:hypothetical protein